MNAQLNPRLTIQVEHYSDALRDELMPMLQKNWQSSASYTQKIVLAPNFERYKAMDAAGMVLCVTARDQGMLIGYSIWYIVTSFNYEGKSGHGVAWYMEEAYRGHGVELIRHAETELHNLGIHRWYWFAPRESLLYQLLEAMDYVPHEVVMEKVH